MDGDIVDIAVPNAFYADWLERQFGPSLREAAAAEAGAGAAGVRWSVDPAAFAPAVPPLPEPPGAPPAAEPQQPRTPRRRSRHTPSSAELPRHRLEDFIVGTSNRLAYSAALHAADDAPAGAGTPPFRVLCIHGECGLGKTHLLQGVARRFMEKHPGAKVRCLSAEKFANEFIASVQAGRLESFRARYRAVDLLCLDDAQFLAGKTATQSEFLHTFDTLDLDGARIVIASDNHPRDIERFDRHLVSRCISGMVVRVDRPDRDTRRAIVRALAQKRGMRLDDSGVEAIVTACTASVREIEGALARVHAMSSLLGDPNTPAGAAIVGAAVGGNARPATRRPVRIGDILGIVCTEVGVQSSEVLAAGRHRRVVLARTLTAALARDLTTHSFPEIARALGRDNHSTIITACQRLKRQISEGLVCADLSGPGRLPVALADLYDRLRIAVLATPTHSA
jgi:chromosomal replication initiator protein